MSFEPTDYLPYDFANRRHIGPSPVEMAEMLKVVGVKSLDELIDRSALQAPAFNATAPFRDYPAPRPY